MGIKRLPALFALAAAAMVMIAPSLNAQVFSGPPPVKKSRPKPPVKPILKHPKPIMRASPRQQLQPPPVPAVPQYVGAIPRSMVGRWSISTVSGFLSNEYSNVITVQGGQLGQIIGRIDYFTAGSMPPHRICSSLLILGSVANAVVTAAETMESKGLSCPGDKRIDARLDGNRLWVTWTKAKKNSEKVTMQGWAIRLSQ